MDELDREVLDPALIEALDEFGDEPMDVELVNALGKFGTIEPNSPDREGFCRRVIREIRRSGSLICVFCHESRRQHCIRVLESGLSLDHKFEAEATI